MADHWCPWRSAHPTPQRAEYVLIRLTMDPKGARYTIRFLCREHGAEERRWSDQQVQPVHMESYRPAPGRYTDTWLIEKVRKIVGNADLQLRMDDNGRAWL